MKEDQQWGLAGGLVKATEGANKTINVGAPPQVTKEAVVPVRPRVAGKEPRRHYDPKKKAWVKRTKEGAMVSPSSHDSTDDSDDDEETTLGESPSTTMVSAAGRGGQSVH